jgi:hypothetical protein
VQKGGRFVGAVGCGVTDVTFIRDLSIRLHLFELSQLQSHSHPSSADQARVKRIAMQGVPKQTVTVNVT